MCDSQRPAIPQPLLAEDFTSVPLAEMSSGAAYHTMNAVVVPRPIAFITTLGPGGVVNAAPFSYFNGVTSDPPTISVAISRRQGALKDTTRNIQTTGHFVVNVCSVDIARVISVAAADLPPSQSEVELTGLTLLPSERIESPRIANSKIQMECQLDRIIEVGNGPTDLVLGRVLLLHAHSSSLNAQGRILVEQIDPLARLAGSQFAGLNKIFSIPRGLPGGNALPPR